jgi:hypothetical protein
LRAATPRSDKHPCEMEGWRMDVVRNDASVLDLPPYSEDGCRNEPTRSVMFRHLDRKLGCHDLRLNDEVKVQVVII